MPLADIQNEITNLTEDDYQELRRWLFGPERRRRQQESGKAELVLDEREAGLRDAPAVTVPEDQADDLDAYSAWEDPGVIHDRMYGLGDRVCHQGNVWESTTPGLNHWEPGSTGVYDNVWRNITGTLGQEDEIEEPIEFPQPEPAPEPEPEQPAEEEEQATPEITEWRAGLSLTTGDLVAHGGQIWRVKINHQSHAGWVPGPATHAVFEQV